VQTPPGTGPDRPVPGYAVRRARAAELDDAGRVVRRAYAADGLADEDYLEVVAAARERAGAAEVVVAVDDGGRVVGTVTFAVAGSPWADIARPGEAEFRMLGVDPTARGGGVGRALVQWCVRRAQALGRERLVLSSLPAMAAAHRLYERLGFVRRPDLDWTPVPGVHLLGFSLEL
jgi:ribosomal protein S18 acetylase RimI-like enzyme